MSIRIVTIVAAMILFIFLCGCNKMSNVGNTPAGIDVVEYSIE